FFFSSRRRHTRFSRDWSSDVCSSDLTDRRLDYSMASNVSCPAIVPAGRVPRGGYMGEPCPFQRKAALRPAVADAQASLQFQPAGRVFFSPRQVFDPPPPGLDFLSGTSKPPSRPIKPARNVI